MPLWFVFISLTLFILYRDRRARLISVFFGLFSLGYLVFLFAWLIPHYENPELQYWGFAYSALGNNPAEALLHIFRHPVDSFRLLFINHSGDATYDGIKKEFYIVFLLSGGLLLFLRPVYLLIFFPLVAQKMFNDSYVRWGINGFYSIEVVSVLTIAAFMASSRLRNLRVKLVLYSLLCLMTLKVTVDKIDKRTSKWYDVRKEKIYARAFYTPDNDFRKIRNQINRFVPSDAAVSAMQDIVPHLAYRRNISIFPFVRNANYIVLLLNGNKYPLKGESFTEEKEKYLNDPDWEKLLDDYPLIVLKRVGS
jgi:uncharacterized membrane protein